MIMGLTMGERDELLKVVAQRIDASSAAGDGEMRGGVSTPREVYDFQLTGQTPSTMALNAGAGMTPPMVESSTRTTTTDMENTKMKEEKMKMKEDKDKMRGRLGEESDKMTMKLMEKIEKYQEKVAKNEMKLARAQRMLSVAEILLAQGKDAQVILAYAVEMSHIMERISPECVCMLTSNVRHANSQIPECATDAMDPEIAMDITELRMMSPDMIEMKRLKYVEKQAKYVRKVAECKMDLAEAASKYEAIKSPTSCATPPPACVA